MIIIKSFLLLFLTWHAITAMPTRADVEKYGRISYFYSDRQVAVVNTVDSRFKPHGHRLDISVPWNFRIVNSFYQDRDKVGQVGMNVDARTAAVSFSIEGISEEIFLTPENYLEIHKMGDRVYVTKDGRQQIGILPAAPIYEHFQQEGHFKVVVAGQSAIRILSVGNDAAGTDPPRFMPNMEYVVPSTGVTGESSVQGQIAAFIHNLFGGGARQ